MKEMMKIYGGALLASAFFLGSVGLCAAAEKSTGDNALALKVAFAGAAAGLAVGAPLLAGGLRREPVPENYPTRRRIGEPIDIKRMPV